MGSKGRPYKMLDVDGWTVLVGRGDAENDVLTFEVGEPQDLWLHVADYSGSHVVVRIPPEAGEPPDTVLARAAELAAWHSKARDARGKVAVHVCRVADVSKPKGFPAGKVMLRRWTAIKVYPRGTQSAGL
ncbi:MAG: DUF814 domain-containing protein [bacterium]|nr:DUF814 domain-containing protein [bacterium]